MMRNILDKFYVRLILVLLISLFVSETGSTIGLTHRLLTLDFYKEYFATVFIAQIVFELVHYLNGRLDKRYDWTSGWFKRLLAQIGLGIVIPSLAVLLLATGYFRFFGVNILKTDYLYYIFPLVLVLIIFLNVLLIMTPYFILGLQSVRGGGTTGVVSIAGHGTIAEESNTTLNGTVKVYQGQKIRYLSGKDLIAGYIIEGRVMVRTKDGDDLIADITLDELESFLDESFFRINRQLIATRRYCRGYQVIENGKLKVDLNITVPVEPIVSQVKARTFKKWLQEITIN
ncbi:LytTR family transcriptional regulator DNA-binding domain-containing protein [Edaphocola aurantiacus]|uniref:LytTR family transcriptional regulator DNA-binding domain-containing protein n=1 Tax=Edaphocola aurantiacus TaxID=2601682 RepID=UPI001C952C73|nr:LytTR family transcriptional regulator DNA-binding domain-containing protein [Edaphocola aurantiacus]